MPSSNATENVFAWLRSSGGRYIRFQALEPRSGLVGVIVHDDGNELYDAMRSDPCPPQPLDVGNRFTAWAVRQRSL